MKIKDGFELINRGEQMGITSKEKPDMFIAVSEIAAFLWSLLKEKPITKAQMLEEALNKFDISTVLALGEIDLLLRMMRENEIIE